MITALDTNVLLDLLIPNARFLEPSREVLEKAHGDGPLILCEAVYAELASQFEASGEIETFLRDTGIRLVPATPESLFVAGRAWRQYSARRGEGWVCPECGRRQGPLSCAQCGRTLRSRQHIISDFQIGAHALALADRLVTRDRGFYSSYFEGLQLLMPA